jgi:hypothetical protein
MEDPRSQIEWVDQELLPDEEAPRSRIWRFLYGLILLIFILILLVNLTGLSHWFVMGRLSMTNMVGRTEEEILNRLGEPDFRSQVQTFKPGEGIGMVPQRLSEGDEFFYLNFIVGPRLYVFHFVSPQTYERHTGQIVLGDEWVVLEYYGGGRYVIY